MFEEPFAGAGDLRQAYADVDWAASPVGPPASWSPTLRTVLDVAWRTRFPVTLFWGADAVLLYNSAYVPLIADKHPAALGAPARDAFPEIWDEIGPLLAGVLQGGEAVWVQDAHLPLRRRAGHVEDAWFTFSYSPVHGPQGAVEGAIDIATETTSEVLDHRRLTAMADVAAGLVDASSADDVAVVVAERGLVALGCDSGALSVVDPTGAGALSTVVVAGLRGGPAEPDGPAGPPAAVAPSPLPTPLAADLPMSAAVRGDQVVVAGGDGGRAGAVAEELTAATGCGTFAAVPLRAGDRVIGALTAGWVASRTPTAEQLQLLGALADQCAQSLQSVQARGAEQRALARTAAVTESMSVGYLAMDEQWRITYVNAEGRRILDAAGRELVGEVLWEVFPATVGTLYEANYRRAVATGEVVVFDAHYPEPLDAWFEIRATPEGGGLSLHFLDITARRSAEEAREAAAQRVSALVEVGLALSDAEDVAELLTTMAERGLAAVGADGGAVAVRDPDDPDVLLSYVTASYGPDAQADYARLPLATSLPVCEAARTGRRVVVPDRGASLAYSPLMADVIASTGSQAFASLPLRAGAGVIGVLTAGWDAPQSFTPEQLDLLEAFAAQCSQALLRLGARDAERAATLAARTAAGQQAALVAVAQALGDADSEAEVLAVLAARGTTLLGANGCGVCLREPDGTSVRVLVTEGYAGAHPAVQRVPADFPLPAVRSATTGARCFLADRAEAEALFPGSRELYAGAGVEASAAVPLRARGQLLGCLSIGFAEPRTWTRGERDLVEAFAALTAQALDRAAAHAAERSASAAVARFSETLQRSLLTAPAQPDHLQVAVRYVPAAAEAQVGGDWYDAFITRDGGTSLVVGDVAGHDQHAAAAMGQVRNLLRGIGHALGEPPAAVLSTVDHAVHDLGVGAIATLVLAHIEQGAEQRAAGTRLLRWSNAGHPPPLLLEPGSGARYLEAEPDLVLGLDPSSPRSDHVVELVPGATVLLYTDGLVERRGAPLEAGLAWLAGAVEDAADLTLDELCDHLLALVGDRSEDDVALLGLRAHPEDAPRPAEAGPPVDPARGPSPDAG